MNEAREMDVRTVLQALNYELFLSQYEEQTFELNKNRGK